ncbi:Mdm33 family-domain-containing protein [Spinellus fusiger]|nr:Mdm33 family-domain-containing protein [Spinellus fusiger]
MPRDIQMRKLLCCLLAEISLMAFRLAKRVRLLTPPCHLQSRALSSHSQSTQEAMARRLAQSRGYLERLQSDIYQHMTPLVTRALQTSNALKRWTSDIQDSKDALQRASRALNELTGYNHIELVKHKVTEQAKQFEATRDTVQTAKVTYQNAIELRSKTQREINELLQRKHLWTGIDVTRFTELYRLEHEHSGEETDAKERYKGAEKQMDQEYMALARSIMERYHEEQLWSDKIRSVSTYGTWALMIVNLLLFVAVQTVFEPRKRKRLTDQFEELLVYKMEEEEKKMLAEFGKVESKSKAIAEQQQGIVDMLEKMTQQQQNVVFPEAIVERESTVHSNPPSTETLPIETLPTETLPIDSIWIPSPNSLPTETPLSDPYFPITETSLPVDDLWTIEPPSINHSPTQDPSMLIISKEKLVLYSIESAVAGGIVTALAMLFWQ